MTKKIPLVDSEVLERAIADAKEALEYLKKKRKKSKGDRLTIEYLKTFTDNPTTVNYVLLMCGRADEMKRKEEENND